eukprot:RCo048226
MRWSMQDSLLRDAGIRFLACRQEFFWRAARVTESFTPPPLHLPFTLPLFPSLSHSLATCHSLLRTSPSPPPREVNRSASESTSSLLLPFHTALVGFTPPSPREVQLL